MMKVGVQKKENDTKNSKADVTAVLNLLQASIILRYTDLVKFITNKALELSDDENKLMFEESVTFPDDEDTIAKGPFKCLFVSNTPKISRLPPRTLEIQS